MSGGSASMIVFAGPTVSEADVRERLAASVRPPAAQGDVHAAARERPWAIGIIDGYFERVPAVWHKEILWAMSQGVRVYGSASMGALRAAELHTLGMRGVGEIFDAYVAGTLEDDDEVTIVHGPGETGYRPASEAMVNIRATVEAAVSSGVLSADTRALIETVAKALYYPFRSWPTILDAARSGARSVEIEAFEKWLPNGRVDRKRLDALAMLDRMREDAATESGPFRVQYRFQHTDAWEQVRRQIGSHVAGGGRDGTAHDALLDELRLDPEMHRHVSRDALLDALAVELAERDRWTVAEPVLRATVNDIRLRNGLHDAGAVEAWLAAQDLDTDGLATLCEEVALAAQVQSIHGADLGGRIVNRLRVAGLYGNLADRARRKQQALSARRIADPTLASVGVTEDELWRWYFEDRLGSERPADLAGSARSAGFLDVHDMRRAVLREYCFIAGDTAPDTA